MLGAGIAVAIVLSSCSNDKTAAPDEPATATPVKPDQPKWFEDQAVPTVRKPTVIYPTRGTSMPLGQILGQKNDNAPAAAPTARPEAPVVNRDQRSPSANGAAIQTTTSNAAPDPTLSFDGMSNGDNNDTLGFRVFPPDPNGDVGPNHYVQWVNLVIGVYDKSGNQLVDALPGNTPWTGFGGPCDSNNDGDPLVVYDQLADRWVFTQFAITASAGHQCFAVSQTADPLGAYHLYDYVFSPGGGINDYPKIGVWPDGYYLTVNDFAGSFRAAVAAAVDREAMLDGLPAALVKFDVVSADPNEQIFSLQPTHLEGRVLPPTGAPNYIINSFDDETWSTTPDATKDRYNIWALQPDWNDPENGSTLVGPVTLDAPEFDAELCGFDRNCIPQPGGGNTLDSLSVMTMYRLSYRNLGTHEAMVLNHTVDVGDNRAGVQWTEIRNPTTAPVLHQTGTFAPDDGLNRWMGSAAMDGQGNIAVGYSVSSADTFPGLRYAARLANDPLGEMGQGEAVIVEGSTAQSGANRWGDYASMSVDELDDCTFWFTGEYASDALPGDWSTRIASFQLPLCTATEIGFIEGTVTDTSGAPIEGARVSVDAFSAVSGADGSYSLALIPGTYDVSVAAFGYLSQTLAGLDVVAEETTDASFSLDLAPLATVSGWIYDGSDAGWPLYAKLVLTTEGAPATSVFTDPGTGFYSVELPVGTDFSASVEALVPGYEAEARPITPGPNGTVAHFGLEVNQGTCDALGYAEETTAISTEDFEGVFPPVGWELTNDTVNCNGELGWFDTDTIGNLSGGAGKYAAANSDQCGSGVTMSATMTSAPVDLSEFGDGDGLSIRFAQDLRTITGTQARVEVWNGIEWEVLSTQTVDDRGPTQLTLGTSSANGLADARVRFAYEAGWHWWWQIDDLELSRRSCEYRLGGLVWGQVNDGNTGAGLVGASVATGTEPTVQTSATPEDPGLGDGLFFTFLPAPQAITASASNYTDATSNVVPQVNGATRRDLSLGAGRIEIDPNSIALRVPFGGMASATMTVSNTGTAPAMVEFDEVIGRGVSRPEGPFAPAGRRLGPKRLFDYDARGVREPTVPKTVPTLAAGEVSRTIASGLPGAWGMGFNFATNNPWVGNISALSGPDAMHEFDVDGTATGRVIDTASYGSIFSADIAYDSTNGTLWQVNVGGDDCIHEVDPVSLTVTGESICPAFGTSERGLAYDPVTDTFYAGSWNDGRVIQFDRAGDILRAVQVGLNVSGLAYNPATAHLFVLSNDAVALADIVVLDANADLVEVGQFEITDGGNPAFADFSQAGLELDCDGNLWAVDQTNGTITVAASGESTSCASGIDWLVVAPQSFTVAAGDSVSVTVTVDASTLTPGLYEAQLLPRTNTPYDVAPVPVAAEVRFRDVAVGSYGDGEIHGLAGAGITFGCGGGNFCPFGLMTRRFLMVWGLRSALGPDYVPPRAEGLLFNDVAPDSFGADFIEDAANRGYEQGCGEVFFCPDNAVTRGAAAVSVLRFLEGADYMPPAATGMFVDVPADIAPFVEEAWERGIIDSCGADSFCPFSPGSRADMAIWLVRAFNFPTFGL